MLITRVMAPTMPLTHTHVRTVMYGKLSPYNY